MNHGKLTGWRALIHLAIHAVIGLGVFAILAIPAVILHLGIKYLQLKGWASPFVLAVLTFVEYAYVVADATLYLFLVGKSLYKASEDIEL